MPNHRPRLHHADVHEVVLILTGAHLVLGVTFFGDGEHFTETNGVALTKGEGGAEGGGEHRIVAGGAVRGNDFLFCSGFGKGVDAFLDRRAQNRQGFVGVTYMG